MFFSQLEQSILRPVRHIKTPQCPWQVDHPYFTGLPFVQEINSKGSVRTVRTVRIVRIDTDNINCDPKHSI